ncbi:hypothetical protein B0H19DRAFT_1136379 [Mycena capillaripes]|nr:hypothetical protein B0H19DRAFT_1136379 [Mycena capillaripes]
MFVQIVSLLALAALSFAAPVQDVTSLGYLRCSSEGQVTGYVSKSLNSFGEYKGVSPDSDSNDVNHRMLVSLDVNVNGTQSILVKVFTTSPLSSFQERARQRFFVLGWDWGEDGSSIGSDGDYLLVGGAESTEPGVKPFYCGNTYTDRTNSLRKCASAIWVYDATTSEVTPQWTNDDGSVVVANIGYVNAAFVLTGDKETFEDTWEDKVEWMTFTFET